MAFPDVDIKDFTATLARTVKGWDLGSSKLALSHMPVDIDGNPIMGRKTDAAAAQTDATSLSIMQVLKQISASQQLSRTDIASLLTATKLEDDPTANADRGIPALLRRTAAPADQSGADGDYEFGQVKDGYLWVAQPKPVKISASFTAAGTATYTAGEWISDSATAGSVTKLQWAIPRGAGRINRIRVKKSNEAVATPTVRVFLWDTTFTVAVGNDAAGNQPQTNGIGSVDVAVIQAGSDDAVGWTNCDILFTGDPLFGLLQSQSSFTGGASELWTVDLIYQPG